MKNLKNSFLNLFISFLNRDSSRNKQKRAAEYLPDFKDSDKKFHKLLNTELMLATFSRITGIYVKNLDEIKLWKKIKKEANLSWKELSIAYSHAAVFINNRKKIQTKWQRFYDLSVATYIIPIVIFAAFFIWGFISVPINDLINFSTLGDTYKTRIVAAFIVCPICYALSIFQLVRYAIAKRVYEKVVALEKYSK
jgi:hypothetical protein